MRVFSSNSFLLCDVVVPSGVVNQSHAPAVGGETAVGVVDAQLQAEFRTRGEHAVRLVCSLGNKIVDQDCGIAFGPIKNQGRFLFDLERGIDPRH